MVKTKYADPQKSKGMLDDFPIRKSITTREGTITKVPVDANDITNKTYVDSEIDSDIAIHAALPDVHHAEAHTHTHASTTGRTADDHHAQVHTIVSHDTTATGTELNTLTDGSNADSLHAHTPPEGTAVLSTGEGGGTKYLREDGDGTSSWQTPAAGGDVTAAVNLTDIKIVQGDGGAKGIKTSTVSVGDVATNTTHRGLSNNPHSTTKTHVGLSNVPDTNFTTPVNNNTNHRNSTGAADHSQVATNKTHVEGDGSDHADVATNTTHRGLTNDPHNVTAAQVGLGNVSNVATSDTAYNATSWNTNTDAATKNAIRDKVETMDTAISSNTSASHAQSHNIASHSDTTATGAELNTLTGGGDTTLHDHAGISENTTHRSSDGSDHADVVTNTAKVSFTKTNVKATINHGGTSGTTRPSGFDSVEWIGTVEPTNATNDDTWIDTT